VEVECQHLEQREKDALQLLEKVLRLIILSHTHTLIPLLLLLPIALLHCSSPSREDYLSNNQLRLKITFAWEPKLRRVGNFIL
jgi:hypothetical protein